MSDAGKVQWFDIPVTDFEKAKSFYGELAGWNLEPMGDDYMMIKVGADYIGGLRKTNAVDAGKEATVVYVTVDKLSEATSRAKNLGADVFCDAMTVDNAGAFQLFRDLDGNTLALWEHAERDC